MFKYEREETQESETSELCISATLSFGQEDEDQENPKVKSSPKEKAQNTHTHTHSLSVFPPRPTNLVTSFSDVVVVVSKKPSTSFWTST